MEDSRRFNAVLAAIASTRSWRASPPLASTVIITEMSEKPRTSRARVDFPSGTWSLEEGRNSSYFNPVEGLVFRFPLVEERAGLERADFKPLGISLFYPLQMPIWGGRYDQLRVVDAEEAPDFVTLKLEHLEDGSDGEAVLIREYGVVTSFRMSGLEVVLTDLREDYLLPEE